jgi:RNA polymerase sigma factor for flagellar operon FliA
MSMTYRGRNLMTEYRTHRDRTGEEPAAGGSAASGFVRVDAGVAGLWRGYAATGDRGPLLLHYAPLVEYVAGRLRGGLPPAVEMADLVSYGIFGLIDAIDKFQPSRGIKFETYASLRIRGAILDELRSIDWVPRSIRTKMRDVERAHGALQMTLNRTPTESEIAAELKITVSDLRKLTSEIAFAHLVPLDDVLYADRPDDALEAAERARAVAAAIEGLREREREVIDLYYYRGLKLTEIGRKLGVTEARVSQLHTRARVALKNTLVAMEA